MKLFGRRRSPEEVAAHIATLERELGIDDKSVLAEVEQRKLERFNSKRGPVLLDKLRVSGGSDASALARMGLIAGIASKNELRDELIEWKPGAKFEVESHNYVQVTASAYHGGFLPVKPPSRVVLPDGVRV